MKKKQALRLHANVLKKCKEEIKTCVKESFLTVKLSFTLVNV